MLASASASALLAPVATALIFLLAKLGFANDGVVQPMASYNQWRNSSLSEVLSSDDPETTRLIYVHENRVSRAESFQRACKVFHQLAKVAPAEKRFRLIAVSWPSDRIGRRQRPDVQIKAQRNARFRSGLVVGSDPPGRAGHIVWR